MYSCTESFTVLCKSVLLKTPRNVTCCRGELKCASLGFYVTKKINDGENILFNQKVLGTPFGGPKRLFGVRLYQLCTSKD